MNLEITDKNFIVLGGTSGFGRAIAEQLLEEGARVIIVARRIDLAQEFLNNHPDKLMAVTGDITQEETMDEVLMQLGDLPLEGVVINAGGPPAKASMETTIEDWDEAYRILLRWKVLFAQKLMPRFLDQGYGRILFIESVSVKQPIDNLVLSNSLRLAVIGFVKTLSQEVAERGITANVLAPGYHDTPAMERLFAKKSILLGISPEEAKREFETEIKTGKMGNAADFGSLAAWLLSPHSRYITGQTISVDGGLVQGIMG